MPRKLLERLAAEQRALLGGGQEGEEAELEGLQAFEEDDSELVFDDVGPEVRARLRVLDCCSSARGSGTTASWCLTMWGPR